MSYQIQDTDRCLVFIKILQHEFFIFALEDDFYFSFDNWDFQPDLSITEIAFSTLTIENIEIFLTKNKKVLKSKEQLQQEFLLLFQEKSSYWDYVDCQLIPKLVFDFNQKILYQTFAEFTQNHYKNLPQDWTGILDENFFTRAEYRLTYANLFYWIIDGVDYLDLVYKRNV